MSDALVADMNEEFAALRNGVGNALRIRCEAGTAAGDGAPCDVEIVSSCEGGIHGAKRWIFPRI